jgi:hypothetical protein
MNVVPSIHIDNNQGSTSQLLMQNATRINMSTEIEQFSYDKVPNVEVILNKYKTRHFRTSFRLFNGGKLNFICLAWEEALTRATQISPIESKARSMAYRLIERALAGGQPLQSYLTLVLTIRSLG